MCNCKKNIEERKGKCRSAVASVVSKFNDVRSEQENVFSIHEDIRPGHDTSWHTFVYHTKPANLSKLCLQRNDAHGKGFNGHAAIESNTKHT